MGLQLELGVAWHLVVNGQYLDMPQKAQYGTKHGHTDTHMRHHQLCSLYQSCTQHQTSTRKLTLCVCVHHTVTTELGCC